MYVVLTMYVFYREHLGTLGIKYRYLPSFPSLLLPLFFFFLPSHSFTPLYPLSYDRTEQEAAPDWFSKQENHTNV